MSNNVDVLNIYLNNTLIGYLSHYQDGKNVFAFDEEYVHLGKKRPTFSLALTNVQRQSKIPPVLHHLKNFSVIYADGINPELSPAYDIVCTIVYINNY